MFSLRQALAIVIGIVAAIFQQYYISVQMYGAAFAVAIAGGFASGYVASGTLRGGVTGAFGAGLTFGIGISGLDGWRAVAAQAFSGGIMESLQGGNFGHGFASAGLTAALIPMAGNKYVAVRAIKGALIGGTISEVTGGKFANGAVSGAIQAAMMGAQSSEENLVVADGASDVSNFSDAPTDSLRTGLSNPETQNDTIEGMVNQQYGSDVARDVRFEPIYRYSNPNFGGALRNDPNVVASVRRFWWSSRPKITFYASGVNKVGSYYGLASDIDHEAFHYFVDLRGYKISGDQNEVSAVNYQMTRRNWGLATQSYRDSRLYYQSLCAAHRCANHDY